MMLSFTRVIASASRRAWSAGLRRMKKVRRCAVFGPMPGSLASSSMSAITGAAVVCMVSLVAARLGELEAQPRRQLHPTRQGRHQLALLRGDLLEGIATGSQNQVF